MVELLSTPAITEGETATETDLETDLDAETETEADATQGRRDGNQEKTPRIGILNSPSSGTSTPLRPVKSRILSQHDIINRYFRKDLIIFHNFDALR